MVGLLSGGAKKTLHPKTISLTAYYRLSLESIDLKKIGDVAFENVGDLIEVLYVEVLRIQIQLTLRD